MTKVGFIFFALVCVLLGTASAQNFKLTILHSGDVRSNFLPVQNGTDTECPPTTYAANQRSCTGGAARLAAYIGQVRAAAQNPVLVLDSGTLFFYQFRGKMGIELMNMMNYTAAAVGVRDFDAAVDGLRDAIQLATFPFLSANLNLSREPLLSSIIAPYTTVDLNGTKVGIVAWISTLLLAEGNPGPTISLQNQINAVRRSVEELTLAGAQIILGISTQEALQNDYDLISQVSGIDAVFGGYGSGGEVFINQPYINAAGWTATGPYPAIAYSPSGRAVPIGSVGRFGRYIGQMELEFDNRGVLVNFTGDSVPLSSTNVPVMDPNVRLFVETRFNQTQVFRRQVVGATNSALIGDRNICRFEECTLGNVVCDAMRERANVNLCIFNAGGIRATIPGPGNITYGDVLNSFPFGNTMSTFSIRGSDLAKLLNHGFSRAENASNSGTGRFLQYSGARVSWNPTLPVTSRLINAEILNLATGQYETLQPQRVYNVTTSNFVAAGGDNYVDVGLPANVLAGSLALFGAPIDAVLIDYFRARGAVVNASIEGRIVKSNSTSALDLTPPTPIRTLFRTSEGLRWTLLAITIALALIPVAISLYFIKNRTHAAVVASSELFVHIILAGAVLTYGGLIAYQVGFNDAGCMIFPWLSSVGFAVMYGALFAKTYRIWTVFRGARTLQKNNVTNQTLAIIVSLFVATEVVLLVVWTAVSRLQYRAIADPTPTILSDYENCTSEYSHIFFAIGLAIKAAYLILGIIMAFLTRKVQSDFRESQYISFSVYGVFVSLVVVLVVLFITGLNPTIRFILTTIGGWIVINTIVLTLFAPKIAVIVKDPENDWETYWKRRAQLVSAGASMQSRMSINSMSDSGGDVRDITKKMNPKQKEEHLKAMESQFGDQMRYLASLWSDIDWLRNNLTKDAPDWAAEVAKFAPQRKKDKVEPKTKPAAAAKPVGERTKTAAKSPAKTSEQADSSDAESSSEEKPVVKKTAPKKQPKKADGEAPKAKKSGKSAPKQEQADEKPAKKSGKSAKKSAKKTAPPKESSSDSEDDSSASSSGEESS